MKIIEGEKYYTIFEVADIVGVHFSSVRRWINQGKLKAHKVSRNYYINAAAVKELVSGEPTEPKAKEPVEPIEPVKKKGKTYGNLKAAILELLESRGNTLDVNKLPITILNTTDKDYEKAFKIGYQAGYYDLLEDIKNFLDTN